MRKILSTIAVLACMALSANAQRIVYPGEEVIVPEGYVLVDTLVVTQLSQVDESLKDEDIFDLVKVEQSRQLKNAARAKINANPGRALQGYRIRIFFDNKQTARAESEKAMNSFRASNPGISCYRTFSNPFFEVTVGDFRSKTEATAFLNRIKGQFPSAIIIKGKIAYPIADNQNFYKVDTLRVLRPVSTEVKD